MQRQKQQTKKENVMLYLASFKGLFMSGMAGSRCSTMTFGSVFSYKLLCVCVCLCVCAQSLSHVRLFCDPKYRFLCPWDFPGKNTGVGCISYSYSRGSSWLRDWTCISCVSWVGRWIIQGIGLTQEVIWGSTSEAMGKGQERQDRRS